MEKFIKWKRIEKWERTDKQHSRMKLNFSWENEYGFLLQRASLAEQASLALGSKSETLGRIGTNGQPAHPLGSPLSVAATAPAPQIDAGTVAPPITGGIFGAGNWPYFGRLSAVSLLAFRGGGEGWQAIST